MKATARSKRDRYQSVLELKQDVERFLESGWRLEVRRYPAGSLIVNEGETGEEAYIIRDGRCRAFRIEDDKPVVLREMGRNDVFGETAVLTDEVRSASVEAVNDVTVAVVTRQHLKEEMGLASNLGLFVTSLAARFREKDARVAELEHRLAQVELDRAVAELLLRSGKDGPEGRREARWSKIARPLRRRLKRSESEVLDAIGRSDLVELDRDGDVLRLKR
jgi:CRP-like cAMP-binding protein